MRGVISAISAIIKSNDIGQGDACLPWLKPRGLE